ncbi:MAG: transglutaminase-like domain-containing protein [Candidatus Asgardarchaeia archaeon]
MEESEKERFWNNKYPKAIITYSGRFIPNYGKYEIDVRAFFINPVCSELQTIVKNWKSLSDDEKALKCQLWVKDNITYVSDKTDFGLEEYWEYPQETLKTRKGDCDDGAILIANLMLASGIPYWKIRLTAGDVDGGHAYVTYYCEEKNYWVACDWCYLPDTRPINQRPDYKDSPIYKEVWFSWNQKYAFHKGVKLQKKKKKDEKIKREFMKNFKIKLR